MIHTDNLRNIAAWLVEHGQADAARNVRAAADEIDAGRMARLETYRAGLVSGNAQWYSTKNGNLDAAAVERDAHAMLAAERAPGK